VRYIKALDNVDAWRSTKQYCDQWVVTPISAVPDICCIETRRLVESVGGISDLYGHAMVYLLCSSLSARQGLQFRRFCLKLRVCAEAFMADKIWKATITRPHAQLHVSLQNLSYFKIP